MLELTYKRSWLKRGGQSQKAGCLNLRFWRNCCRWKEKSQGSEFATQAEVEKGTNHWRVKALRSQRIGKFTCVDIEITKNYERSNVGVTVIQDLKFWRNEEKIELWYKDDHYKEWHWYNLTVKMTKHWWLSYFDSWSNITM